MQNFPAAWTWSAACPRTFGVDIAENFKRPFFAVSINDFWRRWHITLGEWLKDYIFYPVSLSSHFQKLNERLRRRIKSEHLTTLLPSAYALLFVWFANGMWHGASGKYIFYGLYYYALMMLGQALRPLSPKILARLYIPRESRGYHAFEILRTRAYRLLRHDDFPGGYFAAGREHVPIDLHTIRSISAI